MRIYKIFNKTKAALIWVLVCVSLATLLIFPKECRNGGTNGAYLCIQVLIPSLFPFMVLSSFITESGLSAHLPQWMNKATMFIFNLPGCCTLTILLSLVGGYPVGASGIKSLWKQKMITKDQAKRMALFCVAAGPGFLVTYIGAVMTRNLKTGYILLVSQIVSVLILGILTGLSAKREETINPCSNAQIEIAPARAIIPSVTKAINSCALMCALVVIFSSASEVLITLIKDNPSVKWIVAMFEITNGVKILAQGYPTALLSAACGFGGLCVHFQVLSQLRGLGISKLVFFIFRILQSILCGACTYILLKFFPVSQTVFSTVENAQSKMNNTTAGCIVLVICCCAFLISLKGAKSAGRTR
ncbi:MAG: hypothetical protein IJA62_00915 [Ruminococcus sp.]|nr:hypothetical protein [Ruminococcus sp.]